MASDKNFYQDKLVVFLLSVNTFLSILGTVMIFLMLGNSNPNFHIIQYREDLGLNGYTNGTAISLYAFIVFIWFVLIFNAALSIRTFHIKKSLSLIFLSMSLILISFAIIVIYHLLGLP